METRRGHACGWPRAFGLINRPLVPRYDCGSFSGRVHEEPGTPLARRSRTHEAAPAQPIRQLSSVAFAAASCFAALPVMCLRD